MKIAAFRVPVPVGVKATLMVQLPRPAEMAEQLFVSEKSLALTPVTLTVLIESVALPGSVIVMLWDWLGTPTV
jgi:hypothetical protein